MTMTNYEKIKAMSIEEMAEKILIMVETCVCCPAMGTTCIRDDGKSCEQTVKEWLESEVKQDG